MEKIKLTEENIQDLYIFVENFDIRYYDVQTELVDHLAHDIEEFWKENPYLSFSEARNSAFKKFGVSGFKEFLAQKRKELIKKFFKILWSITKEWLKSSKIIFMGCLMFFFYWFLQLENAHDTMITILYFSLFVIFLNMIYLKYLNKTKKVWLYQHILLTYSVAFSYLFLLPSYFPLSFNYGNGNYKTILFSVFFSLLFIVEHICLNVIPNKFKQLLKEDYPELN